MPTALRLTIGFDVRDEKLVEAWLPRSNRRIGVFDIRFSAIFQVFLLPLAPGDAAAISEEGIALRLTQGSRLHIFAEGPLMPPEVQPHLLAPGAATPTRPKKALGDFPCSGF